MTMSVPASKTSLDTLLAVFSTGTVITNSRDDLLDVTETAACLGIELMDIQIEVEKDAVGLVRMVVVAMRPQLSSYFLLTMNGISIEGIYDTLKQCTPYMLCKDAYNMENNQHNLGTIKCSNLCPEVVEYFAPDEVAVYNLASITVNALVKPDKTLDFKKLNVSLRLPMRT